MPQIKQNLTKEIVKELNLNYLLYLPKSYEQKDSWPLILFLHGSGERGQDLEIVKRTGLPAKIEDDEDFPFIVVSPQCPQPFNWSNLFDELFFLLQELKTNYKIDSTKIYLTGLSMGGYGTWELAMKYPEEFAAIVPICGWTDNIENLHLVKRLPIWTFHGAKDDVVPISAAETIVEELKKLGNNVKFTVYPEAGHDSWTETYGNTELYRWLLQQSKR